MFISSIIDFFGWFTLYGGGKGKSSAPDYEAAARQQGVESEKVNTAATWANRPTINTPWGGQTWETGQTVDPATGQNVTNWTQNISLSPEQQAAQSAQARIGAGKSAAAEQLLGQATGATATPVDWSSLPSAPTSIEGAQQGAFGKMSAMLAPQRARREEALDVQLSNQGLARGTEAFKNAKLDLSAQNDIQDQGLLAQSLAEGRADTSAQVGLRNNAIAEEAQRRGMSLNELNALLTGSQVSMPQGMQGAPSSTAGRAEAAPIANMKMASGQYDQGNKLDIGSLVGTAAGVAGMMYGK